MPWPARTSPQSTSAHVLSGSLSSQILNFQDAESRGGACPDHAALNWRVGGKQSSALLLGNAELLFDAWPSSHCSTATITESGVDVPAVIPTVCASANHSRRKSSAVCT